MPAVKIEQIINILLRVSEMICALPHIQEMDINPIIINDQHAIAVDTRMVIAQIPSSIPYSHLAIHPYPDDLISSFEVENHNITLRPIRPEDAELEQAFIHGLSEQSKYYRFMENIKELSSAMLIKFTQIDYDREMAMVAALTEPENEKIIGIARYIINPDGETAEFAIVIADAWHKKGIGSRLLKSLMTIAKDKNIKSFEGVVLSNNTGMLELAKHHEFSIHDTEDSTIKMVIKQLH
jgi:acetyltransferase